ncbi:MAG: FG-GAP-like repeat-containing protein [Actinomycetota bacterium]
MKASLVACVLFAVAVLAAPASTAPSFVASFELDNAPSWQTSTEKSAKGTWIKHSSPVVADLGSVGRAIIVASQGGRVYALRYSGGKLTKIWDTGNVITTFIDSSPAVGDLNRDGCPEIVVGAGNEYEPRDAGIHVFDCHGSKHRFWKAPTYTKPNHVGVFSTPAISDMDGDGYPDVIYGSFNERIYVKDRNGKDLPGWPRENLDTIWSSPAIADIDGSGKREIILGTDLGGGAPAFGCAKGIRGTLSIWNRKGEPMPNFPKCMDTPIWSSPAVTDIDGNGTLDVVIGTNNYLEGGKQVGKENIVRAYDTRTGKLLWDTSLPDGTRIFTSPAIGDVGGDGSLDVAVGTIPADNYGEVYLLDARTGKVRWHHQGGRREICACKFMGSPVMADVDGDGKAEVIATSQDGGVNAWDEKGSAVIDDLHAPPRPGDKPHQKESFMFFNSPAVYDADGDGDNELILASAISGSDPLRGKVWIVATPGTGKGPWPFFKKSADRLSAEGTGKKFTPKEVPADEDPAPAPAAPAAPSGPSTQAPRTSKPTAEPDPRETPEATVAPVALPEPIEASAGMNGVLVGGAIASVLSGAGVALFAWRRRLGR